MRRKLGKNIGMIVGIGFLLLTIFMLCSSERARADEFSDQLARAILEDPSTLVDSDYTDKSSGDQQAKILDSFGSITPLNEHSQSFILLSTGVAGAVATTDANDPGDERGTWFGPRYPWRSYQYDKATLTLQLRVPDEKYYVSYKSQFFSTEAPEWVDAGYNDRLTITINSPSKGLHTHITDVDTDPEGGGYGGDLVFDSYDPVLTGTGFDLFARIPPTTDPDSPEDIDWVSTTPGTVGWDADAGATFPDTPSDPVSPGEIITVTISIKDAGDNQLDSTALIDCISFSSEMMPTISAEKIVEDLNGGIPFPGDTLKYSIYISNDGLDEQKNNSGDEFEDYIPDNTTYVLKSASAFSPSLYLDDPVYNSEENKITWNGEIPSAHAIRLNFNVIINSSTPNGTIISNHGIVNWDDSDDGTDENNATENVYANITVLNPKTLIEDFSDDESGGNATASYSGFTWFETSEKSVTGNFEIASSYHYLTSNSFKTKLRLPSSPQYWNYTLSALSDNIKVNWWETWFTCGNASEAADLLLIFTNNAGQTAAIIKFDYVQAGNQPPMDWLLELSYWNKTINDWTVLRSDFTDGYLHNDWYKLKIEENDLGDLSYSLNRTGIGEVAFETSEQLDAPFSELTNLKWESEKNPAPVVCPIFFWDEHTIGLGTIS